MPDPFALPHRLACVCALVFCALLASPALAQNAVPPDAESVPFLTTLLGSELKDHVNLPSVETSIIFSDICLGGTC